MTQQQIQLEINFNKSEENAFRTRLNNAEFQITVELPVPSADTPLVEAVRKYADFADFIKSRENPCAQIAFVNDVPAGYSLDPVTFASELCKESRSNHIIYLNGMGRTVRDLQDMVGHAVSEGFRNFCAYCGTPAYGSDEAEVRKYHFAESTNILHSMQANQQSPAFIGTMVNPYQYSMSSAYAQSFHMFRDIANGASFITTSYGWDAKKLQELVWNLYRSEVNIPVIAGLAVLTPENAETICAGKVPGVHVSPDFIHMLRQERTHSFTQFQAAQLRHLQIHAAGAKLLGYNGIQLSGTTNIEYLSLVFKRIREALNEFRTFDEWKAAYFDYYDQMTMIPYPSNFYMFKDLLKKQQLESNPSPMSEDMEKPSGKEKLSHNLAKLLCKHADTNDAAERRITKKILVQCHACNACTLPQTDYVCPYECPMELLNGSCGLNNADGTCHINGNECIFAKRIRFAAQEEDFSSLSEGCIPENTSISK